MRPLLKLLKSFCDYFVGILNQNFKWSVTRLSNLVPICDKNIRIISTLDYFFFPETEFLQTSVYVFENAHIISVVY